MVNWNIGSISNEIFNLIDGIPSNISGTTLNNIVIRKLKWVEKYVGVTIDQNSISTDYQLPILNLAVADLLTYINVNGFKNSTISLGEFSVGKSGQFSATITSAEKLEKQALEMLDNLEASGKYANYRTW